MFAAVNTEQQITLLSHSLRLGPGVLASLHGLMVIALLPAFLYLHGRSHSRSSSTAGMLVWGYVATAAAFALMTGASLRGGDAGRVSSAWLIGCYALLSLAEVLLAPLGVSLVTRLAPRHRAAQSVGLWFAGSAVATDSLPCWVCAGTAGRITATSQRWRRCRWLLRSRFFRVADIWTG